MAWIRGKKSQILQAIAYFVNVDIVLLDISKAICRVGGLFEKNKSKASWGSQLLRHGPFNANHCFLCCQVALQSPYILLAEEVA